MILVVGAGPVGLTMAAELARHGAPVRVVDKLAEPVKLSKAVAVHARTLEAFADMGLAERFLAAGHVIRAVNLYGEGRKLAHVSLDPIDSPYPLVLDLAQDETEALLTAHLDALGVAVERGVELVGLADDGAGVEVTLRHDGREERASVAYVVGCDGAHSTVRHALGLPFEGAPYELNWILGDLELIGELARDEMHTCLHPDGLLACFPLSATRVRLIADRAPGLPADAPVTVEEFQDLIDKRGLGPVKVGATHWLTAFRIHHRMVPRHAVGRVFLCGDAAHIHSPAGGQGMNTGIQDAYNLGWKLARVLNGTATPALLETYHAERSPVAAALLHDTDVMTRVAALRGAVPIALRNHLVGHVASLGLVQHRLVNQLAEVEIAYHGEGSLGAPQGWFPARGLRAGDRVPDVALVDAPSGRPTRLHACLAGPRHTLLVFCGDDPRPPAIQAVAGLLGADVQTVLVSTSGQVDGCLDPLGAAHERFGATPGEAILVRPDKYLACRGQDQAPFLAYLARWQARATV